MLHVIGCITEQHDLRLVLLAALLCLFAAFTSVSLLGRAQASEGRAHLIWVIGAGFVTGSGIWATHFVGMLAYQVGFPVTYDIGLTALSVLMAIALCSIGFGVAMHKNFALAGGAVAGAAIGAMHYVGMAAMRAPVNESWDWNYVIASVLLGIVLMACGMQVGLRYRGLRSYAGSAAIFTLAICGTHFTGMAAVQFTYNPLSPGVVAVLDPSTLAIAISAVAAMILGIGMAVAVIDQRMAHHSAVEADRLRDYVGELEATKHDLEKSLRERAIALTVAAAANKSKSAFLAAMSHELRTPLNAIIGFSEMMGIEAFGPVGNARYKDYVNDIHSSGKHLLALINDILDLSRLDAGKAELHEESIELATMVGECLRLVETQAKAASVALETDIPLGLAPVLADERRLKQVLINLLANAVKFTPAGGQITVQVSQVPEGMAIAVIDTGIGIAPKDLHKAFENYGQIDSTVARKHVGAGLGLPLARQLMELHGGTLTLESRQNVGTTVTATLPAIRILACNISVAA